MPRDAYNLPLQDYLQLRLKHFLSAVRACGLPVDRGEAMNNFPLWEREYNTYQQQLAA